MPSIDRPTVALTGASGFLGRHLVTSLTASGWRVRAISRSGRIEGGDVEVISGSLDDGPALDALVGDVDAIVHAAGLVKALTAAEFTRVNVEGTARLLRCAQKRAPGAHVVLVSSLAAREPQLSPYAASKREAEERAKRLVGDACLTIVRPPALYGPYDTASLSVFQSVRLPLTPLLARGDERIAMLHVADAADMIADLVAPRRTGLFSLADERPGGYSMRDIFTEAGRAVGSRPRFVRIPRSLFLSAGYGALLVSRLRNRATILSPGKVREMLHKDWSVARDEMPPRTRGKVRTLEGGFSETVAWYRAAGWL